MPRLRTAREREHAAERFAERAVEAQEAERSRLSREIHDGIAQRLASLGFHLSAAERALPEHHPEGLAQIMMARRLCELAAAETRAAIGGCARPSWTTSACRRRSPPSPARPGTVPAGTAPST
ncbi:histidine kinase [Actinomadura luteofluorescens]|uniref:histidine kinase n=1 Tax=Actinomadura luteofluorescens TaxID=46163 RepID=UPI00362BA67A